MLIVVFENDHVMYLLPLRVINLKSVATTALNVQLPLQTNPCLQLHLNAGVPAQTEPSQMWSSHIHKALELYRWAAS